MQLIRMDPGTSERLSRRGEADSADSHGTLVGFSATTFNNTSQRSDLTATR
jgi:hypothetical protein